VSCHDLSQKQTWENISLTCTQCHDRAYVDLLKGWKKEILEALKKTRDSLDEANKKLTQARKEKREVAEAILDLDRAEKAYAFLLKAKGVHNADLALAILGQAQKDAQKAGELFAPPREKRRD